MARNRPVHQEMNAMIRYVKLRTVVACCLLATSLSALAAVSASTATEDDHPSRVVKFADLDLSHSPGAAVLYTRIRSAAREVCLPANNWMMELRAISDQCRNETIARAVADIHAPALTTYYMEQTRAKVAKR
jgi:UrcA family protein